MEPTKTLELLCNNKKIQEFIYDSKTQVKNLRENISSTYSIQKEKITLIYDKKKLENETSILESLLLTKINQIGGEKIKVKIIPQIHIEPITKTFVFKQLENEDNNFSLSFDIFTKIDSIKDEISSNFNKMLSELNYIVESVKFLNNPKEEKENLDFKGGDKVGQVFKDINPVTQYFLVKNSAVNIYKEPTSSRSEEIKASNNTQDNTGGLTQLSKNISSSNDFNIIIQTYNGLIREIRINNQMTVYDLKEVIERELKIGMEYQELFYLVYRLNQDEKKLIRYNLKPKSTVFLRGFYFPIIFSDFYTKKQNFLKINIATKVAELKNELINKFKLDCDYIDLVCNGKILDNERFLIEYCIQKLQTIYIK